MFYGNEDLSSKVGDLSYLLSKFSSSFSKIIKSFFVKESIP